MRQVLLQSKRSVALLFFLLITIVVSSCDSQKTIVNGLDEREANEILVFLASKNIDAAKTPAADSGGGGGQKIQLWDITVSSSQSVEAMALLNAAGLPRRRGQDLLNIFSAGGLVPSEMQQKVRYQAGLAAQIANTIRKIDGVLDCDVQLSFPEEDPLNPNAKKGAVTCSVYVKHNGVLDDPNSHLVTKIKRLVASSVNGLDFDHVTVIGDRARYADVNLQGGKVQNPLETVEYVRVWSIDIAKRSLTRFQVLFFSFTIFSLVAILSICWLLWKLYPVLKNHGGVSMLFKIAPLEPIFKQPTNKSEENTGEAVAEKPVAKENVVQQEKDKTASEPPVQENIESP